MNNDNYKIYFFVSIVFCHLCQWLFFILLRFPHNIFVFLPKFNLTITYRHCTFINKNKELVSDGTFSFFLFSIGV